MISRLRIDCDLAEGSNFFKKEWMNLNVVSNERGFKKWYLRRGFCCFGGLQ